MASCSEADSLAQLSLAKLESLKPRWYAAKESVGIDILHALRGQEGDDFGGLFAMVELLLASERERERLAKQVQNDSVTIVSLIEINAADGAKLASLERVGNEDHGSVACGLTPVSLPRGRLAGSATPSGDGE